MNLSIFKNKFNYITLKQIVTLVIGIFTSFITLAQDNATLSYFLKQAKNNAPRIKENNNLLKIGELQNSIILAQNKQ